MYYGLIDIGELCNQVLHIGRPNRGLRLVKGPEVGLSEAEQGGGTPLEARAVAQWGSIAVFVAAVASRLSMRAPTDAVLNLKADLYGRRAKQFRSP